MAHCPPSRPFRRASRSYRRPPSRVLRGSRPTSLRTLTAVRRHPSPHHAEQQNVVERHHGTVPPDAVRRTLPGARAAHLDRDHRRNADGAGHLPCRLQSKPSAPGPAHERPQPLPGVPRGPSRGRKDQQKTKIGGTKGRRIDPRRNQATAAPLSGDCHLFTPSQYKPSTLYRFETISKTNLL